MRVPLRVPAYRVVLVPLDASAFAEQALPYAEAVARAAGARIELVLAHEYEAIMDGLVLEPAWDEEVRERSREYLERVAAEVASRAGVQVEVRLLVGGRAAVAVERGIRDSGADLVVMSTHGRTGLARAWLGSVADTLVRHVDVPLLLVRPREDGGAGERVRFDDVVVALDGSVLSEAILPHAAALGRPGGTRYTLVRVVPPALVVGGHVMELDEERARELVAKAEAYLRGVAGALRPWSAEVRTRTVKHSAPAAAILDVAAEVGADLIAMTTHGYGGLRRLLLGGTADKVLRGATCPVLMQRPGG
ncbi:MAG TPA: universal stress protein [Longimicrobiales bacterium]